MKSLLSWPSPVPPLPGGGDGRVRQGLTSPTTLVTVWGVGGPRGKPRGCPVAFLFSSDKRESFLVTQLRDKGPSMSSQSHL